MSYRDEFDDKANPQVTGTPTGGSKTAPTVIAILIALYFASGNDPKPQTVTKAESVKSTAAAQPTAPTSAPIAKP